MTLTLELAPDVESGLNETARRQGKTPEQLAAETLRANLAARGVEYPTARQLLAMPEPEQRELTANSAIDDDIYDYSGKRASGLTARPGRRAAP